MEWIGDDGDKEYSPLRTEGKKSQDSSENYFPINTQTEEVVLRWLIDCYMIPASCIMGKAPTHHELGRGRGKQGGQGILRARKTFSMMLVQSLPFCSPP